METALDAQQMLAENGLQIRHGVIITGNVSCVFIMVIIICLNANL